MEFTQALADEVLQRLQACLFFHDHEGYGKINSAARVLLVEALQRLQARVSARGVCPVNAIIFDDARVGSCGGEHLAAGTRAPGAC